MQVQRNDPTGFSILQVYKKASNLRREPSFQNANIHFSVISKSILSYIRHMPGCPAYLVAVNLGFNSSTDDYTSSLPTGIKSNGEIVLTSCKLKDETLSIGQEVNVDKITLLVGEGIVIKLETI